MLYFISSLLICASFVLLLYFNAPEKFKSLHRDSNEIILFRMGRICWLCMLAFMLCLWVSYDRKISATHNLLNLIEGLGLRVEFVGIFTCLSKTMILFLGPLVQLLTSGEPILVENERTLITLRNYLVAPFAEEFIYRCCCIFLWQKEGIDIQWIIFTSPLLFAGAHVHHFIEHYKTGNLRKSLMVTVFQFSYTLIFGWYASYLFIKFKNFLGLGLTHSFCNFMGFPEITEIPYHRYKFLVTISYAFGLAIFFYMLLYHTVTRFNIIKRLISNSHENVPIDSISSISDKMKTSLKSRGIESLFPIQFSTLNIIKSGKNILAKAKTGTGKTLAFLIPALEMVSSTQKSKGPGAVILCPTRELAKQVSSEIDRIKFSNVKNACVYGGVAYGPQISLLNAGVDIVVGTPGRMLDLIEKGCLSMENVNLLVLDEADYMLDIGFKTEMESIMNYVKEHKDNDDSSSPSSNSIPCQVLLFSATVPPWVHNLKKKYLGADSITVDLVGDSQKQGNDNISYLAMPCNMSEKMTTATNIVRSYRDKKIIIFTSTKFEADNVANALSNGGIASAALHGDINQGSREAVIKDFRSSKVRCLVATDVAARGLDVPNVDLVIQYDISEKVEPFLHRSGRTGRAGNSGECITLFDYKRDFETLKEFEQRAKLKFKILPAPGNRQLLEVEMKSLLMKIGSFDRNDLEIFDRFAEDLLQKMDHKLAVKSIMAASCNLTLFERSSITGVSGITSLLVKSPRRLSDSFTIRTELSKISPTLSSKIDIYPTISSKETIVDIPATFKGSVLKASSEGLFHGISFEEISTDLPELRITTNRQLNNRNRNTKFGKFKGKNWKENLDGRNSVSYKDREQKTKVRNDRRR